MYYEILIFVIFGILSGVLSGLLGIGGGFVTVPALYFMFHYAGMVEDRIMHISVATSLAAVVLTAATATVVQHAKKTIHFSTIKLLIPGLVIGGIAGSIIGRELSGDLLRLVFGIIAIVLGVYFFFPRLPLHISSAPNRSLSFCGLLIGVLSSLLGIGGGSLTFPVLLGYQVPVKNASATSSAATFLTSLLGTATYLIIAWHREPLPYTFGDIELPAFLAISIGAVMATPFGVKLSHTLNVAHIKQIFGCTLSVVGLSMLLR